jgi:class 3 adenylate cyclase
MDVVWQNDGAIDQIWQNVGAADNGDPTPNLLDLLFSAALERQIANYSRLLEFFFDQLRELLSEDEWQHRMSSLTAKQQKILSSRVGQMSEHNTPRELYGGYIQLELSGGKHKAFVVVALNCGEGRLLIFEPHIDRAPEHRAPARRSVAERFERIRRHPNPIETSCYLLAAQVSQASILKAEMLADDHWRLINALCRRCLRTVEHFGGLFGQHVDHGFFAYFLPDQNHEPEAMNVIECALEIKAEAHELARQWKIRKNWLRNIELNIGLHYEKAYIGTLSASSGDILTSFGQGLHVAGAISHLSDNGQIWASKPVIVQIPAPDRKTLRFGIMHTDTSHSNHFIRNGFATIGSVVEGRLSNWPIENELGFLPVTQILDLSGGED